jgi:hypothetical protein
MDIEIPSYNYCRVKIQQTLKETSTVKTFLNREIFWFFTCTFFNTAPPLTFYCVGGCWDQTQD